MFEKNKEWQKYYHAPRAANWKGRIDGNTPLRFHEMVKCIDLREESLHQYRPLTYALIGFTCDEGIRRNFGRIGASQGPLSIRKALAKLPVHTDCPFEFLDCGDIFCPNQNLEDAQLALSQTVSFFLGKHVRPILIGGGHEIAWGHYIGVNDHIPNYDGGIVNIDAHLDIRGPTEEGKGNSGTSFRQMTMWRQERRIETNYYCIGAQRFANTKKMLEESQLIGTKILFADEFHLTRSEKIQAFVEDIIQKHPSLFLSICLDVFAAPFAPGVSAPNALGIFPWHVIPLIRTFASKAKNIHFNIAELCPPLDQDERTAQLAARLIAEFIQHNSKSS